MGWHSEILQTRVSGYTDPTNASPSWQGGSDWERVYTDLTNAREIAGLKNCNWCMSTSRIAVRAAVLR